MSLGCVQDVSVWVLQAFHRDLHGVSIDVDPAGRPTCQEGPGGNALELISARSARYLNTAAFCFECTISDIYSNKDLVDALSIFIQEPLKLFENQVNFHA